MPRSSSWILRRCSASDAICSPMRCMLARQFSTRVIDCAKRDGSRLSDSDENGHGGGDEEDGGAAEGEGKAKLLFGKGGGDCGSTAVRSIGRETRRGAVARGIAGYCMKLRGRKGPAQIA